MTQATLNAVGKPSEPWGQNRLIFIDLTFSDHAPASLATNEQGLASRLRELNERIGKPAEYEFGQNQKGKATVKIPKPEGQAQGGGGQGKARPLEERAEILASVMLKAAVDLTQDEHGAVKFDHAANMVIREAARFLTEARRLLGVEAVRAEVSKVEAQAGTDTGPIVPASTSHSETAKPPRQSDPAGIAEQTVSEQTSGGDDSSSSPPDGGKTSDGGDRSSPSSESAGPGGEASLADGEASGGSLSGPATPQQLETLANVYGSKSTIIRKAHALLGFSGGWDELTAEDARRLILAHAGVTS